MSGRPGFWLHYVPTGLLDIVLAVVVVWMMASLWKNRKGGL